MAGSRCPTYSPLLNVMCLFVYLNTKTLTDVFSLMFMDAIYDGDIRVPSFCGILISNEVTLCSLIAWPVILIGMTPLCLGSILRST